MMIRGYRDLSVWQKGMGLAVETYRITERFPKSEVYGLTSQMRRAAASVPANIAEGRARRTTREFIRFMDVAYGSLAELETFAELSVRLGYLSGADLEPLTSSAAEIGRMLNGLQRSLRSKLKSMPRES